MGRSALLMAIDNENLDMVELLINHKVDTKDALLHAISEEFVEAVEMLLDHEDQNERKEGQHVSKNVGTHRAHSTYICLYLYLNSHEKWMKLLVSFVTITLKRIREKGISYKNINVNPFW